MRASLTLLFLLLIQGLLQAQNPGLQATQIASQATQIANQNLQQASLNALRMSSDTGPSILEDWYRYWYWPWISENSDSPVHTLATPNLSIGTGTYSSSLTVAISSTDSDVQIYYTTDGWAPTQYSTIYAGPIQIDNSATLQAVAVSPWGKLSSTSKAIYTLHVQPGIQTTLLPTPAPGVISNAATAALSSDKRFIAHDTAVPLVFAAAISSKKARVGDKISLTLAEDLKSEGVVVASRGASAVGVITEVDKARGLGKPGEIAFKLQSLRTNGIDVKLRGGAATLGDDQRQKADTDAAIGLFVRGKDARIDPGAKFTAFVKFDTVVPSN